jgi:XisH protein
LPALDQCHEQIVRALQKAGWTVDDYPYVLPITNHRRLFVDIHARRYESASPQSIIVVEVKCFSDPKSELQELYTAIGQYLIYRSLLNRKGMGDRLYLAIPTHAYPEGIFGQLAAPLIQEFGIKMMVVDVISEVIEQWLK